MTGKSPVRSCEDIDESVLSYAEVKALATGNPHIKEKMTLDVEVAKLKMMKANFSGQKYQMEDNIAIHYPKKIAALESKAEGYRTDIQTYMQNRPADKELFSMKVGNTEYHSRKEAGMALIEMCRNIRGVYRQAAVGEYQGFKMSASYSVLFTTCTIHLEGSVCHESEASADPFGIIQRLDNVLEAMPKELEKLQRDLDNVQHQLETAKLEVSKPFEKEQELAEKTARLAELNSMLNMDENVETGQPGHAGGQDEPEIHQSDSPETDRKAEDALKQPSGKTDEREQTQGSANAAGKQGKTPPSADGKEMPGYMQVRASVREKLAAIRERRAAEQAQKQVPKPQIKKDRAAVL